MDASERANELVRRYVLDQCYRTRFELHIPGCPAEVSYREGSNPGTNKHLLECPDAVADVSMSAELWYDTGVEALRFTADISCPHGEREDYEYGELGDLPSLLEDLERDYPDSLPSIREKGTP